MEARRWLALDVLRGLSIVFMLMNLAPGAWDQQYDWLEHAKWEGVHFIDLVAPAFLFCVGAAIPLSLGRRSRDGAGRAELARHVLVRTALLVGIGLFLNAYPAFDWGHMRIPGVLQRIGLCYGLVSLFVLAVARREDEALRVSPSVLAVAFVFVLLSYWAFLRFVPVPGFGSARFDPLGSWPAVVDRAVFGTAHLFPYFPIDGKVLFDPEGIISTYPACATVLLGALVGELRARGGLRRPALALGVAGSAMMGVSLALGAICPIVKNLWTSTFVLYSGGYAILCLALFSALEQQPVAAPILFPARVFGSNPFLAYVLCFLVAPLLDWKGFGGQSLRGLGQGALTTFGDPKLASLLFSLIYVGLTYALLWVCWRRRWFLKL